jgi:hypothetical protein
MLIQLAEAYTEALNKGGIPVIESAWQYMQSTELENAFRDTVRFHTKLVEDRLLKQLPVVES